MRGSSSGAGVMGNDVVLAAQESCAVVAERGARMETGVSGDVPDGQSVSATGQEDTRRNSRLLLRLRGGKWSASESLRGGVQYTVRHDAGGEEL